MIRVISVLSTITIIVLISTTFSMLPNEQVEIVRPNEPKEIIMNIYTRSVQLESNFVVTINISISKINVNRETQNVIFKDKQFEKTISIDFNRSGYYLFVIESTELIQITFSGSGMRIGIPIAIIIFLIIKIVIWIYQNNFIEIDYFIQN